MKPIQFNKASKWFILFEVLFVSTLLFGLTKLTQVALVNSTIDSTPIGQSVPAVATFTSAHVTSSSALSTQGAYIQWNRASFGDTDFANAPGSGPGGFYWYNGLTPTQIMFVNSSGVLTANGFIGPLTGSVTGNLSGNVTGSISGGTVQGTTGTFGNLIAACNGCGSTAWNPGSFTQGTWFGLNNNGGANGESDLINRYTSGNAGGFSWFSLTGSSLTGQVMNLTPAGTLTVNQVNANVTGNLTGTASKATALAGPTFGACANYQGMYAITATGNAFCAPTVFGKTTSVNSTAAAGGSTTSTTVPLSATYPDTGYTVSCSMINAIGFPFIYNITKSTTSVTVFYSNGVSSQAVVSGAAEIDCTLSGT